MNARKQSIWIVSLLVAATISLMGGEGARNSKPAAKSSRPAIEDKQAKQLITGSHIPTPARRVGRGAETPSPVYIIDRREIEQSGAASVGEVLRRCPAVR